MAFFDPLVNPGNSTSPQRKSTPAEVIMTQDDLEQLPSKTKRKTPIVKNLFGDDSEEETEEEPAVAAKKSPPAHAPAQLPTGQSSQKIKAIAPSIPSTQPAQARPAAASRAAVQSPATTAGAVKKATTVLASQRATGSTADSSDDVTSLAEELAAGSLFADRPADTENEDQEVDDLLSARKAAEDEKEMESLLNIGGNEDLDKLTTGILDGDVDEELLDLAGSGAAVESSVDDGFDFSKYIQQNSVDTGGSLFEE